MKSATGTRMAALRPRITNFSFSLPFSFLFSGFVKYCVLQTWTRWHSGYSACSCAEGPRFQYDSRP